MAVERTILARGDVYLTDLDPTRGSEIRKTRPSRFAARFKGGTVAVVLDPDVASVFRSSESVNALLRSVISALPEWKRALAKSG